ncbi:hypothetical protein DL768_010148 [Monosporascus sp. mg162]|nr:hypothetical protein DL768_010148 [Monosporascus sp. mg162]
MSSSNSNQANAKTYASANGANTRTNECLDTKLFLAAPRRKEELFKKVLNKYYEGETDEATEERLLELSAEA